MTSTTVLSPPIPVERSQRWPIRGAAIVFVALLALVAFGVGRAVLDDGPTHRAPAVVPAAPQVDAMGTMAQLNALFDTPEGHAALVREFGSNSFGATSSSATPTSPSTSDETKCTLRVPC